jgi:hypothetical protein
MAGFDASTALLMPEAFLVRATLDLSLCGPPVMQKGRTRRLGHDRLVTRVGAQVASQRCPILRAGKTEISTDRRAKELSNAMRN